MAATAAKGCYQNPSDKLFTDKKAKDMGTNGVSQELHLKMSKKIAQLTKVIYALNTRNDEHEAVVDSLKESHEAQMSQVLTDTKEKISKFQSMIGNEMEYKRKITRLETCVADFEKFKKEAMKEFEDYKKMSAAKEEELLQEHNQMIGTLQRKLETAKDRYQQMTARLETLTTGFEQQKAAALEEQKASYQKWIDELVKNQSDMQSNLSGATDQLHDKYKKEIAGLSEKVQTFEAERAKLCADYEAKLSKAQQFYEKELKVLQERQESAGNEEAARMKKLYEESKKEFYEAQATNKKRVEDLLNKISVGEEEEERLRKQLSILEKSGGEESRRVEDLKTEIDKLSNDLCSTRSELKIANTDLLSGKEYAKEQAADIAKKAALIGELQASLLQQESALRAAQSDLSSAQKRLQGLEREKAVLAESKNSLTSEQAAQVAALEKALSDASNEKKTAIRDLEAKLQQQKEEAEKQLKEVEAKQKAEMEAMLKKHRDEHRRVSVSKDSALDKLREEFDNRLEYEKMKLEVANTALKEKMEALREELSTKLRAADSEAQRLRQLLGERDSSLASTETALKALQAANQKLQTEAAALSLELRSTRSGASQAAQEIEKAKQRMEAELQAAKQETAARLKAQTEELERKFAAQLQRELAKTRADVKGDAEAGKKAALEELTRLREEGEARLRAEAAQRVAGLEQELAETRRRAQEAQAQTEQRAEAERRRAEEETRRAAAAMREMEGNWKAEADRRKEQQTRELREAQERADRDARGQQERLKEELRAEMRAAELAHRVQEERRREEEEEKRRALRDELQTKANREKEEMRTDLLSRFGADMGALQRDSENAQLRLQEELESAKEEARNQIDSLTLKFERAQFEIRKKENCIAKLEADLKGLQEGMKEMGKELDQKGKEVLKARSEINHKVKQTEEELRMKAEREMKELRRRVEEESAQLLSQFNEAQELLKDKISELKIRLEDAEERYRNRESRDEDLEQIEELRKQLEQREKDVRRLYEEKKFFQMELVNRETNFNKVFNNSPQVGLVNPLTAATKVARKDSKAKNTRLAPLPNSPLHDDALNPSRPLPPPAKKFAL